MKEVSLFLMQPFSFTILCEESNRKERIYNILITVNTSHSPEQMSKQVFGKIYERQNGTVFKVCFDGPSFGIFDPLISNIILEEFSQKKSSFDFMKGLSCNIGFKKLTLHNARVYRLIIIDHQLKKKVLGRVYKKTSGIVVIFDKPHFGVLNSIVAEAIKQEMLESKDFG